MFHHHLTVSAPLLVAGLAAAQSLSQRPEFEVASIKLNTSGTRMVRISGVGTRRLSATNASLRMLITIAYGVKNFQVSGGGSSIDSDRYDIEAKAPADNTTRAQSMLMMQAMLEDRFRLKVHRETKEMPVYALVPGKGGLKIPEFDAASCREFTSDAAPPPPGQRPPLYCGNFLMGPNTFYGARIGMAQLVDGLSNLLGRPVLDKTGYTGAFNVHLEFSRDGLANFGINGAAAPGPPLEGAPPVDATDGTIFTALQEQLGLRLESQKGPAEVLVIDHAEKASEN